MSKTTVSELKKQRASQLPVQVTDFTKLISKITWQQVTPLRFYQLKKKKKKNSREIKIAAFTYQNTWRHQMKSDRSVFDKSDFHLRAEMRILVFSTGVSFSLQRSRGLLLPIWIPSSSSSSSSTLPTVPPPTHVFTIRVKIYSCISISHKSGLNSVNRLKLP